MGHSIHRKSVRGKRRKLSSVVNQIFKVAHSNKQLLQGPLLKSEAQIRKRKTNKQVEVRILLDVLNHLPVCSKDRIRTQCTNVIIRRC
jgi:hypothetical protein